MVNIGRIVSRAGEMGGQSGFKAYLIEEELLKKKTKIKKKKFKRRKI